MKIKSKLLLAGSVMLFTATMAFGAITSDQLATQYQADGYSYITIKTGVTQIKVEAVKDGTFYEVVYDIETGATIDTSSHAIGPIGTPDPGVTVKTVTRDFEDDHGIGDDDGPEHDLLDDDGLEDDSDDVSGVDAEDDHDSDLNDDSHDADDSDDDSDDDRGGDRGDRDDN